MSVKKGMKIRGSGILKFVTASKSISCITSHQKVSKDGGISCTNCKMSTHSVDSHAPSAPGGKPLTTLLTSSCTTAVTSFQL